MPNGFAGSPESWKAAESVLNVVDALVAECLQDRHVIINRNYHSWPCRSVEWVADDLQRKVQIFLSSEKELTYNVWLCASKRTGGTTLRREAFLRQNIPWEALSKEIRDVLMQAVQIVDSWTVNNLAQGPSI